MPEELLNPPLVHAGEEATDVRVEHPVHLLLSTPTANASTRRAGCVPAGTHKRSQEVLLVDGVEHLDDGPLDDLVLQRGYAERSKPPVWLRDVRPPRRTRPVAARVQPPVQVVEIRLQVLPVGHPRHPVHPRRGLRAYRSVGRPEPVDVDMVQQRREPRVLVPSCHFTHTVQRAWRASRLSVRDVLACPCSPWLGAFPPPAPRPLARCCSPASQVLPPSDFPCPFISGVRLRPSLSGPPGITLTGNRGISRFSCLEAQRMPRFFDRAGSAGSSR